MWARRLTTARITLIYALVAGTWIIGSDALVAVSSGQSPSIIIPSMGKGLLFVAVTAALLYLLIRAPIVTANEERDQAELEAASAQDDARILRLAVGARQLLLRAASEQALFEGLCETIVADPGFLLAWVGSPGSRPEDRVVLRAAAGPAAAMMDGLVVTSDHSPTGLGPTGTALRERRTVVIADAATDASVSAWRDELAATGIRSVLALPIAQGDTTFAALSVYMGDLDAFNPATVRELERLAVDIGFAVATYRAREERAAMEARLRQGERLEVLGQFAGILAHDVRNVLTAISFATELVVDDLPDGHPALSGTDVIRRAVEDGTAMTQSVLEFARPSHRSEGESDLAAHVRRLDGMLRRLLPAEVVLETALDDGLPRVRIDGTALTQVIVNLTTNAGDAMPDGGRLRLEADTREVSDDGAQGLPPGRYVRLRVSDTGTGMDKVTSDRVFEAFFTTKSQGTANGTGLGLSSVFLIVSRAGGAISVESSPGSGTTFIVDLPVAS